MMRQRPILVGSDQQVPLVTGQSCRYVNLDYAASTPALLDVVRAVEALLPWYSSVHRGAGFKSQVSTAAYEMGRHSVHAFVNARPDDVVIFTRNTTESINLLSSSLPNSTHVVTFAAEHHANLLPWRRGNAGVHYLPVPGDPGDVPQVLEDTLKSLPASPRLVAVSGASNVTGELWPVEQIAVVAHRHGARVLVDAAQLAPHVPLDMRRLNVDYLAISGHKLYAPFGTGALIGRADWLREAPPHLFGGGAVEFVTLNDVLWTSLPDRQEAGSPNVLGAVAIGAACRALSEYGMDRVAAEEAEQSAYARRRLSEVPGITQYAMWPRAGVPTLGIHTFNLAGFWHSHLAAILSAEYGVGVRHGCFCAHPLMTSLIKISDADAGQIRADIAASHRDRVPGAVRASLGLGTTHEDIDYLVAALESVRRDGPGWHYSVSEASGEYEPDPDSRVWPELPFPCSAPPASAREACCMPQQT